ncbi:hypothetical protein FOCC_FOCC011534 [Frankliniella occidentalis]|nr:hypothetical protein FOCC_FOCC011534 [Frankliniella occidentalis]
MSIETRSSSALFKRAEQLKRWEESETNREDTVLKTKTRKIKFSAGCVFLAACASGDKEEVVRLLEKGADIDTANVDGLTALHQACIDDNLDMVEFLVEHGADVNRGDNEGWTPLHATASCGFISIAKYLIEHGANVAAVNNDGELPLDIAESDEMEELLLDHITTKEIDCDEARGEEERMMMMDAKEWINNGEMEDKPHPKTGASALHVAAAKGYIKVISVLLQGKVDINSQDCDGWTPLHAAAHWGQKEACEMLVEHFCDMEIKNYVGQTAFDVADLDMVRTLEELKKKQATLQRDNGDINAIINKKAAANTPKRRMSGSDKSSLVNKDTSSERQVLDRTISEEEGPPGTKVKKVEVKIEKEDIKEDSQVEKKNQVNRIADGPTNPAPSAPPKLSQGLGDNEVNSETSPAGGRGVTDNADVVLRVRRTQSFIETDDRFYRRYQELHARIKGSCPSLPSSQSVSALPTRSASLRERYLPSRRGSSEESKQSPTKSASAAVVSAVAAATAAATAANLMPPPADPVNRASQSTTANSIGIPPISQVRRSFVPPVRDEESETQRKAHAKRVRETRRSTQGVTLEEIKSAEQLVKKKQQQQLHQATQQLNNDQFLLEDARNRSSVPEATTAYIRRPSGGSIGRPASAPSATPDPVSTETTVTLPLRRQIKPPEDKEQDKENDSRNAQATQAVIARRKRPKRRSTGVVHVDLDEIDPDRQEANQGEVDDSSTNHNEAPGLIGVLCPETVVSRRDCVLMASYHARAGVAMGPGPLSSSANSSRSRSGRTSSTSRPSGSSSSASSRAAAAARRNSISGLHNGYGSSVLGSSGSRPQSMGSMYSSRSPYGHHGLGGYGGSGSTGYLSALTTYGGTSSGYGGLLVPSSSSTSLNRQPSPSRHSSSGNVLVGNLSIHPSGASSSSTYSTNNRSRAGPSTSSGNTQTSKQRARQRSRSTPRSASLASQLSSPALSRSGSNSSIVSGVSARSTTSEGYVSGAERSGRSSRLGSTSSAGGDSASVSRAVTPARSENGEIDYKKLYEESQLENERLREKLKKTEDDLRGSKALAENSVPNKNSLSEIEKRERRAMERKLSEMEEELKLLEQLKTENQRLKDENGALIRVISKLSK